MTILPVRKTRMGIRFKPLVSPSTARVWHRWPMAAFSSFRWMLPTKARRHSSFLRLQMSRSACRLRVPLLLVQPATRAPVPTVAAAHRSLPPTHPNRCPYCSGQSWRALVCSELASGESDNGLLRVRAIAWSNRGVRTRLWQNTSGRKPDLLVVPSAASGLS